MNDIQLGTYESEPDANADAARGTWQIRREIKRDHSPNSRRVVETIVSATEADADETVRNWQALAMIGEFHYYAERVA